MVKVQVLVRIFLVALLFVDVLAVPVKGSKSKGQTSPSDPGHGSSVGSSKGFSTGYSAPAYYTTSGAAFMPAQAVPQYVAQPQYVQAQPVPGAAYATSVGSVVPAQPGYVGASELAPAAYTTGPYIQAGYAAAPQQSGAQANMQGMEWLIAPKALEEASTDTQAEGLGIVGPELPQAPAAPSLQSGETSNVVKEAELGNYQQQTEEFGYPANRMVSGPGFPVVALPSLGVGGLLGYPLPYPLPYPYPEFDYRLLYGLYPEGTYTTFSKNHERGKDYYQSIHYLKEHGSENPGSPQNPGAGQHKVYPDVQQRST